MLMLLISLQSYNFHFSRSPTTYSYRALIVPEHPTGMGRCLPGRMEQKKPSSTSGLGSYLSTEPRGPSSITPICTLRLEMTLKALQTPAIPSEMDEPSEDGASTHPFHASHARLATATSARC